MMRSVEDIEHDIDALNTADKSRVLRHLVADLDAEHAADRSPEEVEAEWVRLAERRLRDIENGSVEPVALEDVVIRLRRRFRHEG